MARFKKGQSGNPGGRPRAVGHVREIARQHTTAAVATLVSVMKNPKSPAARVAAANAILDRGYGRPGLATIEPRFVLPELTSAADASRAVGLIVSAVASGKLTPAEADDLSHLIEVFLRMLEAADFERRLQLLEQQQPREKNV
jgi:Family of unknown function (DUF5681)